MMSWLELDPVSRCVSSHALIAVQINVTLCLGWCVEPCGRTLENYADNAALTLVITTLRK